MYARLENILTSRFLLTAPEGVSGPVDVVVLNGYVIDAKWLRPTGRTGAITKYILRAVNRENTSVEPVEAIFENVTDTLDTEKIPGNISYFCQQYLGLGS